MNIVTLTLCPAFDIHADSERIVLNRENIAKVTEYDAGGKGVNISRALSRFNVVNTAVIAVGEENGDEFIKKLKKENLSLQYVVVPGRIRENITIHTGDGKETRISFNGDAVPENLMSGIADITDGLCSSDTVLTFTGRLPTGVSVECAKEYIRALQKRGVKIVIDSKSFTLADITELSPFLIKPNEEEIEEYMGQQISDFDSAANAARKLNEQGIENVMISLGAKGAILCTGGRVYSINAPKINAISTIGAGDSSIAGFLFGLAEGRSAKECLRLAVAFGSAACLSAGTNPPDPECVKSLLEIM